MKTVFILLAMLIVSVSAADTIQNKECMGVGLMWGEEVPSDNKILLKGESLSTELVFGSNLETALRIGFKGDSLKITTEMPMDSASQVFLEFLKKYLTTPENWCDKKGGKN